MAERTRVRIPLLSGGISSQPDHMVKPDQVRTGRNVNFVASTGVCRRPGTCYVATVTGPTTGADLRLHPIFRDESEKYIVVYGIQSGQLTLKVYDEAGNAATMSIGADAETYLESSSATTDDIGIATIADTTILWNRKATPATFETTASYTITGTYKDYGVLTSIIGTPDAYYSTSGGDEAFASPGNYQYVLSSGDNGWAHWVGANAGTGYQGPGGKYDEFSSVGFRVRFQRQTLTNTTGVTYTHGTLTLTFSGNHGYVGGTHVHVSTGAAGIPAGYYAIASTTATTIVLSSASGVDASGNAITATADSTGLVAGTTHTSLREVSADCNPRLADMYEIAETIEASLQAGGGDFANALVNWTPTSSSTGRFQIVAPYRGNGTAVTHILAPTTAGIHDLTASGRPFNGGTFTAGTGSPATATATVTSRWESVPAPGDSGAEINNDTMPVELVRTATSPSLEFTLRQIDWNSRTSGSALTNPGPSFFADGLPIKDICYFKDRFWYAAGQYIYASADGDYFNLWIEDSTNIVDSDPFEITVGEQEVARLEYLVPWRNKLVAFSGAGRQYESNDPDVVAADKFKFSPSTRLRTIGTRPTAMDFALYVVTTSDDDSAGLKHCTIREMAYNDVLAQSVTTNIGEHAWKLFPATFRSVHSTPNVGVLIGVEKNSNVLYVYRTLFDGARRLQSAWSSWSFDTQYRIMDGCILDTDFWIILEDDEQFVLERITLERAEAGVAEGLVAGGGGDDGGDDGGGDDGGGDGGGGGGGGGGGDSIGGGVGGFPGTDYESDFGGGIITEPVGGGN